MTKALRLLAAALLVSALPSCGSTDETTANESVNQAVVSGRFATDLETAVAADPSVAGRPVVPAGPTVDHLIRFFRTNQRAWLSVASRHGSVVSETRPTR